MEETEETLTHVHGADNRVNCAHEMFRGIPSSAGYMRLENRHVRQRHRNYN